MVKDLKRNTAETNHVMEVNGEAGAKSSSADWQDIRRRDDLAVITKYFGGKILL